MKKIHIYILSVVFSFSAFSCQDWMNVDPAGVQTTTTYWQTKGEVEAVLGKGYKNLRDAVETIIFWGETRGNELMINNTAALSIRNGDILPTNSWNDWSKMYAIIGMANSVIKYAPEVSEKDASFNEGEMRSTMAEAHFLRGLSSFYLVRMFKDVPYITEPYVTDDAEFQVGVTDGYEILRKEIAAITPYLEYAKEFFPEVEDTKGRATRWALYALVADMNLWIGDYKACVTACDAIINSGRVGLIAGNTWFTNFYPGNSNESIFEIQYSNALSQTNSFKSWFAATTSGSVINYGKFATASMALTRFYLWLSEGDVRGEGATFGTASSSASQFTVWKYYGIDTYNTARGDLDNDQNWIIYRLAEIYLMKAEAVAMQGDYPGAIEIMNEVRTRAGSDALDSNQYADEYSTVTAIYNERFVELFAEGKNWFDMLRIGLRYESDARYKDFLITEATRGLTSISAALVRSKMNRYVPYSWYLPIYNSELEANIKLEQNPAYANYGN